jgi:ATP-dependent DNA helicase RecQ
VEAFYQEAGRAGRDGVPRSAHCFILYSDDNWAEAERILSTQDHREAAQMLNRVNRRDRGDLLIQLWFLFNTYQDRGEEKEYAFAFWQDHLSSAVETMGRGARNTVEVPFRKGEGRRSDKEKAIFRLVMLGVVDDYAINWRKRHFTIRVHSVAPDFVKSQLETYLRQYKFEEFARGMVEDLPQESLDAALEAAIHTMVDFVYDEIVAKRKQALRTMAELCRDFESDTQFREAILAYLQDSEFTPTLKTWVNRPFEHVQIEGVYDVLDQVTTLDEAKRLIGTTRRMLDEDPSNLALRYLSSCARIRSEAEGEGSVMQESKLLLRRLGNAPEDVQNRVFLKLLSEMEQHRPEPLSTQLLRDGLRAMGSAPLVRTYLRARGTWPVDETSREAMLKLLTAESVRRIKGLQFHNDLVLSEDTH